MTDLKKLSILLVERNREIAQALKGAIERAGHSVTLADGVDEGIATSANPFDVVLHDTRPVEEQPALEEQARRYNFSNIISESKPILEIFETVKRLASFKTTILISGESGTGKELLARAIHFNSNRRNGKFVAINCGAIPESLIESELFGHKMGAFTDAVKDRMGLFEEATGGTIFLDEIGELPLHLQVKLLRVLQEQAIRRIGEEQMRPIDVRVLAASHRDLERGVREGTFREDLFYRLNVVHIHLPSLRERPEDIPVLVKHFIDKHNKKLGTKIRGLEDEVMECFLRCPWKGNIRELENAIERGIILTDRDVITMDTLPEPIRNCAHASRPTSVVTTDSANLSIKQQVKDLETGLILKALEKTKGNRTHAAKLLEISHRTLLYKIKEYDLVDAFK